MADVLPGASSNCTGHHIPNNQEMTMNTTEHLSDDPATRLVVNPFEQKDFEMPDMPAPKNTSGIFFCHRESREELMNARRLKEYHCRMMDQAAERGEVYKVPAIHEHLFFREAVA